MLEMVLVAAVAGAAALGGALALDRKRCPKCGKRAVRLLQWESRGDDRVAHHVCHKCASAWRSLDGRILISREAFDAGVRAPLPTAKVHREGDR